MQRRHPRRCARKFCANVCLLKTSTNAAPVSCRFEIESRGTPRRSLARKLWRVGSASRLEEHVDRTLNWSVAQPILFARRPVHGVASINYQFVLSCVKAWSTIDLNIGRCPPKRLLLAVLFPRLGGVSIALCGWREGALLLSL